MPVEKKFSQGSVIYFEHEKGDSIYILKSGQVEISYIQPESGEKITKPLLQGEFFGLKSAIIGHIRDEVAVAVTDVVTVEFKVPEFELFASKNVELIKRLLRVLSNQLRNLGIKVNNYLGNNVILAPNIGMFKIGEYYLNNKQYKQAIQVYERYLKVYGHTNLAKEAEVRINMAKEALKTGMMKSFRPVDEILGPGANANLEGIVDIKPGDETKDSALGLKAVMDKYYKGEAFFKSNDYVNAENTFKQLFTLDVSKANPKMISSARIMYYTSLLKQKKYTDCVNGITSYITTIKEPNVIKECLMIIADVYKELGKTQERLNTLQKIAAMPPVDDISKKARALYQAEGGK